MKVRKTFGQLPEEVIVLSTPVAFDEEGYAEVEEEIGDVLARVPGYLLVDEKAQAAEPEEDEEDEEDASEEEEKPAPKKKAAPKRPSVKK